MLPRAVVKAETPPSLIVLVSSSKSSTAHAQVAPRSGAGGIRSLLASRAGAGLILLGLAILVRLVDIGHLAKFDELYTLPAAQSWMNEGVPRIADGVYDRAQLYTMLLAGWFKLFGDSLVVARLLSVLFGSLLVVGVFWWTDAVAGRAAAWISALFVALGPTGIEMSQFARFYTLHALAFWLGAIGVYSLATGGLAGKWRQVAVAIGSALCLLLALHLQILTLMGGIGLGLWLVGFVLWRLLTHEQYRRHWPWVVLGLLICVVAAVTVAVHFGGLIAAMFARYLETPLHVMHHQGEVWFYHLRLIEYYPTLWPIFPFLAIFALAARPSPSIFAICVFGAAFVFVSFGGQRSWRYLYFAMPFLFVVWGIALASIWYALRDLVLRAIDRVVSPVAPGLRSLCGSILLIGSFAFLLVANGGPARTLLRPVGIQLGEGISADWPDVVLQLQDLVRDADVVVTSHELHMLHYLGRADIVLSKERLAEFSDAEFGRDRRTGLPAVSQAQSLELIMSCYGNGVIVTDTLKGWRSPTVIDEAASDFIVAHTEPIDLPPAARIKAFKWQTPIAQEAPAACATIPGYRDADSAS
jgi:4-amino-4-deoxy-L-arabinose transferase-like glycosyltransferase